MLFSDAAHLIEHAFHLENEDYDFKCHPKLDQQIQYLLFSCQTNS